ncbi:hypothetical protein H7F15_02125 [Pontibacter sp. Tf4]|uniref:hypothetical protein n=1 Tax=Pontibacter sp. Tf4 TaxID=2761620 RepID=UPI001626FE9A|nr:hypothetical protein [Pontibacter sp. Tf4]MBB6609824.1 hypothetical protein [Pontibacter sp. Tf4]
MKKYFGAVLLLLIVAASACDSLDERFVFYINKKADLQVTPGTPVGTVTELGPTTIVTNADTTFMQNHTRAELVQDITLDKFGLTIADTVVREFGFLESVDVYMSAEELDEVRVAFLERVAENDTILTLNLTNTKLDEYLKKEAYTIHTRARLRKAVPKDLKLEAEIRFKVIADPI